MSRQTTIVLAVIAALLAVYIAIFEREGLTTGELASRRDRVIQSFVRSRVTDIALVHGDERVALHREREENLGAFELGEWRLTEPIRAPADNDAVDQLLSSLEWLDAERSIEGVTEEDIRTFGLDSPQAQVEFTAAGQEVTFSIGGEDARGGGLYARSSDRPDRVAIVGRDVLEALDHDADHFRERRLFSDFSSLDASAIELRGEAAIDVRRDGEWWKVEQPFQGLARESTVEALFDMVRQVRASRFLEGAPSGEPVGSLVVRRERDENNGRVRLEDFGACPADTAQPAATSDAEGQGEQRRVRATVVAADGTETVLHACVPRASIEPLSTDAERIQERRLALLRPDELDRAELVGGLVLRREDDDWLLEAGGSEQPADGGAIEDWVRELAAIEAIELAPATDEALAAHGLSGAVEAEITLRRANGERTEVLKIGAAGEDGVWVRRGDHGQIGRYPVAARALLTASSLRFRQRQLIRDSEGNVRSLRIARAGSPEEVIERQDSAWTITAPLAMAADRVIARDIARSLAELTAVRFEADQARAEHQLEQPRIVVRARFEGALPEGDDGADGEHDHGHEEGPSDPPREVELQVGAATDGGAFARLGSDPAVFVIASDLIEDLSGPLASRDALATETSELESLVIVQPGQRIELRREGDGWTAGTGPADEARTTLILDRLASLRAIGTTSYGPPSSEAGFGDPTLVLEVTRRRGEPRAMRIEIGAAGPASTADDAWYHGRRRDLAVGYRLSAGVVRTFLEYQP